METLDAASSGTGAKRQRVGSVGAPRARASKAGGGGGSKFGTAAGPPTSSALDAVKRLLEMGNSLRGARLKDAFTDAASGHAAPAPRRELTPLFAPAHSGFVPDAVRSVARGGSMPDPSNIVDAHQQGTPLYTRQYVEAQFVSPNARAGERGCARGSECSGRAVNAGDGVILREWLLPSADDGGYRTGPSRPCMLCTIDMTAQLVLDAKLRGEELGNVTFPFRVVVEPGEYTNREVLLSSKDRYNGPLWPFPIYSSVGWNVDAARAREDGVRAMRPPVRSDVTKGAHLF